MVTIFKIHLAVLLIWASVQPIQAQDLIGLNSEKLQSLLTKGGDTVYVVHFWATWCKPCVEELPEFEQLQQTFSHQSVRFIYISCDFPKQIKTKLLPFLRKYPWMQTNFWINEHDPERWVGLVDAAWSGALPATCIIQGSHSFRYFSEGSQGTENLRLQIQKALIH